MRINIFINKQLSLILLLGAGCRTLFLARARNKSCAEPLHRSMATQRFSHTATRHAKKQTPFAGGRTLFLARARNKSCAEPLRRSMAAQRFSHTATRHAKKQTPFAGGRTLFLARARNKSCAEPLRRLITAQRFSHTATRHAKKQTPFGGVCFFGAGGRTRTGTVSLPVDFESTTSANSITPACNAFL